MQKTLAATAIAALMSVAGAANAADIYSGGYKDAPLATPPLWLGWYFGGHVGGAFGSLEIEDLTGVKFDNTTSSVFGGGQFGFLYQRGNLVIGPEVDLGSIGISHTSAEPGLPTTQSRIGSGFYFDVTARLGYAYGPALIYAKGGLAGFEGSLSITDGAPGTPPYSMPARNGFTVGGGVEYKFNPSWSVKAEYQYFDFSSQGGQFTLSDNSTYNYIPTIQAVQVGINYHLGACCALPLK